MLRTGLTAAGLLLATALLVAGGRAQASGGTATATKHTCGAQDKQFIRAAALSTTALTMLGQDYQSGALGPKEAISETRDAEIGIRITAPRDPSLKLARTLMRGMMDEYERAVRAQWKGQGDAGQHMYRSYAFANYGHGVLVQAQPALGKLGCSVADLLQQ